MKTLIRFGLLGILVCSFAAVAQPAYAQETTQETPKLMPVDVFQGAGILIFKTPDDRFKWWLDGRVMLDSAFYLNSDNTLANGTKLRRGRFAMNMVFWGNWASQFDVDFAENAVDVKDAWIGYTGIQNSLIRAGNFREPFGLETLTSSRYISFMERSLIDNFSPDRHVGVAFAHWRNRWQASAGFFGPELEDTVDEIGQDQGYSMTARFTVLPILTGRSLVHLGAAVSRITPKAAMEDDLSDADIIRVRARPETDVNQGRMIDSGKIKKADYAELYGAELAAVFGPVSLQGEYNRQLVHRLDSALPEPMFDGWYAYASWFPTGESRPYDRTAGEFVGVQPKSPRGAVELLARYSTMNLNDLDANIKGGKEDIVTVGANYYFNSNIRVMVNYLFVKNDQYAKGDRGYTVNDKFNILQARFQLNF